METSFFTPHQPDRLIDPDAIAEAPQGYATIEEAAEMADVHDGDVNAAMVRGDVRSVLVQEALRPVPYVHVGVVKRLLRQEGRR